MTSRLTFAFLLLAAGCSGGGPTPPPTEVDLGETTFVVVVNPAIDDVNDVPVPEPGLERADVLVRDVALDLGGPSDADGVYVLPLPEGEAGVRTLELSGGEASGTISQEIAAQDLVEVALSGRPGEVQEMVRIRYAFGREVVELSPEMGIDAVNDALSASDRIVLLGGGVYEGDLVFGGSDVALFGAGVTGGEVTIVGNVTVSGQNNRIRGAIIDGDVTVSGSECGLSFTRVSGATEVSGSGGALLANEFCGGLSVGGDGTTALGNATDC